MQEEMVVDFSLLALKGNFHTPEPKSKMVGRVRDLQVVLQRQLAEEEQEQVWGVGVARCARRVRFWAPPKTWTSHIGISKSNAFSDSLSSFSR